jgi:HNH endonuclease
MIEITAEYLASQGLSETFFHRFWKKVTKQGECWVWIGGKNENGYGVIGRGRDGWGLIKAHRASWVLHNGPIPDGLCVLHHCDNPPCVRPDHLFLGDHVDNGQDASAKGRMHQGNDHWNIKISDEQVTELRFLYKRHSKNQKMLAEKFGISVFTLRRICYGTTRKHAFKLAVA